MNLEEQQYLNLLQEILDKGDKQTDRTGIGTLSVFSSQLKFSLENGQIPLLTTKKMFLKGIIEELLFFIRGETDTKILESKGVNIWKDNTSREFLDKRNLLHLPEGHMGKGYGYQWRNFNGDDWQYDPYANDYYQKPGTDQLQQVVDLLKNNPYDRRIILSAWNPAQLHEMALPPCHIFCQFYVNSKRELSSQFYMRSVDTFLGLPFNLASYAIFTHLIAKLTNLKPKELTFVGGNTHIYLNHIEQVNVQIAREPLNFPQIKINKNISSIEDMEQLTFENFELLNYTSHSAIKGKMAI